MRLLQLSRALFPFIPLGIVVLSLGAGPSGSLWEIHLRDGSVLKGSLSGGSFVLGGSAGGISVAMDDVEEILFAERYEPDLVERALSLVQGLGNQDYSVRERSSRKLEELGGLVLPELREALMSTDPEVKFRARGILKRLEARGAVEVTKEDLVRTSGDVLRGVFSVSRITATVEGQQMAIAREEVVRILRARPGSASTTLLVDAGKGPVDTGLSVEEGMGFSTQAFGHTYWPERGRSISPSGLHGISPGETPGRGRLLARIGREGEEVALTDAGGLPAPSGGKLYLRLPGEELRGRLICKVRRRRPFRSPPAPRPLGPDAFGDEVRRIDFDHAPDGSAVQAGDSVETLYAPWGVILESENPDSYVAADGYAVASSSRGNSAANRKPRWMGDITLRFILPGSSGAKPRSWRPGGVSRCGLFVAAVTPNGTGLEAFDRHGRLIGRVYTKRSGTDFLGIASKIPIFSVRVFDVPSIDPNFSIDDLLFDVPVRSDLRRFAVSLKDGQRLVGRPIRWEKGALRMRVDHLEKPAILLSSRIDAIHFASKAAYSPDSSPRWASLTLSNGDRISGKLDSWGAGEVSLVPWGARPLKVPIRAIRTADFSSRGNAAVEVPDGPVRVFRLDGTVLGCSSIRLSDRWGRPVIVCEHEDGPANVISLEEAARIALPEPPASPPDIPQCAVLLGGGDLLTGTILGMDERRVILRTPYAEGLSIYRSSIDRIEFFGTGSR